jgi:hypothetical protein
VSGVTVEEVGKGFAFRLFTDLGRGQLLDRFGPRAEWLLAVQRKRLAVRPKEDSALLMVRRAGRPVARLAVHVRYGDDNGRFGFFATEDLSDVEAAATLLQTAVDWLAERGRVTMTGPLSWTADQEAGVLVAGHDLPPVTGRAWTPPCLALLLENAGLAMLEEMRSFQLPAEPQAGAPPLTPAPLIVPKELAAYADPALLLTGPDDSSIVAVPDVVGGLAEDKSRGAWALARKARTRAWEGCVVLALDGPEDVLIPGLCAAAGRAGYSWVLSPWAPENSDAPSSPAMIHRLYRREVP